MNHQQSDLIKRVQHDKVFEFAVVHRAGGIVDIVVGDDDFFDQVIDPGKSRKLAVIRFLFCNAVGNLNEVNLVILLSAEIDLTP